MTFQPQLFTIKSTMQSETEVKPQIGALPFLIFASELYPLKSHLSALQRY